MAESSEQRQPTHRVYSVIHGGAQGDALIDIGYASPAKTARVTLSCFTRCRRTVNSCAGRLAVAPQTEMPTPSLWPRHRNKKRSRPALCLHSLNLQSSGC